MRHRHLDYPGDTAADALSAAAIDDIVERGGPHDWAPLVAAVRADPWGPAAQRILTVTAANPRYGITPLWQRYILTQRQRPRGPRVGLAELRRRRGLSQKDIATRTGVNQPAVSKLEKRDDTTVSTLDAYVAATGGTLRLVAHYPGGEHDLEIGSDLRG